MELDCIYCIVLELECCIHHVVGGSDHLRIARDGGNRVAMGHPDLGMCLYALQERGVCLHHVQHCASVLPCERAFHAAAASGGDVLRSVADPEKGKFSDN